MIEDSQDVGMAQTEHQLELSLILASLRHVVALDGWHDDDRHVPTERGLVRRIGRRHAVPLGLLDDPVRADIRARDETHSGSVRDTSTGRPHRHGHCGGRAMPCQRTITPELSFGRAVGLQRTRMAVETVYSRGPVKPHADRRRSSLVRVTVRAILALVAGDRRAAGPRPADGRPRSGRRSRSLGDRHAVRITVDGTRAGSISHGRSSRCARSAHRRSAASTRSTALTAPTC